MGEQRRRPKGEPGGGQFAKSDKGDPETELVPDGAGVPRLTASDIFVNKGNRSPIERYVSSLVKMGDSTDEEERSRIYQELMDDIDNPLNNSEYINAVDLDEWEFPIQYMDPLPFRFRRDGELLEVAFLGEVVDTPDGVMELYEYPIHIDLESADDLFFGEVERLDVGAGESVLVTQGVSTRFDAVMGVVDEVTGERWLAVSHFSGDERLEGVALFDMEVLNLDVSLAADVDVSGSVLDGVLGVMVERYKPGGG